MFKCGSTMTPVIYSHKTGHYGTMQRGVMTPRGVIMTLGIVMVAPHCCTRSCHQSHGLRHQDARRSHDISELHAIMSPPSYSHVTQCFA